MNMKIFSLILAFAGAVFYFSLNPEFYYDKKLSENEVEIYASKKVDFDFSAIAGDIKPSLERARANGKKIEIFIVSSQAEFFFFTYGKSGLKYWINPFNGKALLNVCVFEEGRASMKDWPKASLRAELAKAAVAASVKNEMETLSFVTMDKWRLEGLSAYYSGEMPLYSPMDFCSPKNEPDFLEFENMMIMKYMLESMKLAKESALKENYLRQSLIKEARPYLCKP
ncbi:MAG: hypothetical protein Fur0012_00030 [Elusimicrobiota bacterium]